MFQLPFQQHNQQLLQLLGRSETQNNQQQQVGKGRGGPQSNAQQQLEGNNQQLQLFGRSETQNNQQQQQVGMGRGGSQNNTQQQQLGGNNQQLQLFGRSGTQNNQHQQQVGMNRGGPQNNPQQLQLGGNDHVIGHYQVKEKIGQGGSGIIYLVTDFNGGRELVLKFVDVSPEDPSKQKVLEAELRVGLHLNGRCPFLMGYEEVFPTPPNLRKMYGAGFFLVMEYCAGGTLAGLITQRRNAPLPQRIYFGDDDILRFVFEVGRAMQTLHRENIVHRDLKCDNIFLTADGKYKVGDFSISRVADSQAKATTSAVASVAYASPEFLNGNMEYTKDKDVYSLGCILLEFIDLVHPFCNESGFLQQGRVFMGQPNTSTLPSDPP